jgi:hypothetical protein
MNAMELLLSDELHRLVDRIATNVHENLAAGCGERRPDLLAQLADSEIRVAAARQSLLRGYATWQSALEECEGLWALADLAAGSAAPGDQRAA